MSAPIGCDGVEDNKPSPKNARMRIYRNLRARRFLCVERLTYAFQNLKRRSRPIQSGDFAAHLRSLIFPSEGKIFVAVFAVFGRSKNGVSSFS